MQQNLGLDSKGMARAWVGTLLGGLILLHALAWRSGGLSGKRQAWAWGATAKLFFFPSLLVGAQESGSLSSFVVGVFGVGGVQ